MVMSPGCAGTPSTSARARKRVEPTPISAANVICRFMGRRVDTVVDSPGIVAQLPALLPTWMEGPLTGTTKLSCAFAPGTVGTERTAIERWVIA